MRHAITAATSALQLANFQVFKQPFSISFYYSISWNKIAIQFYSASDFLGNSYSLKNGGTVKRVGTDQELR